MQRLLIFGIMCFCVLHYTRAKLTWPESYHLKAVLKVPSSNITEPYEVWVDGESGNHRIDLYNGMTKIYRKNNENNVATYYRINPESTESYQNKMVCHELSPSSYAAKLIYRSLLPHSGQLKLEHKENLDGVKTARWSYFIKVAAFNAVFNHTVWTHSRSVWVDNQKLWTPVRYEYRVMHEDKELQLIQHIYAKFSVDKPNTSVFDLPSDLPCSYYFQPSDETTEVDPVLELVNPEVEHTTKSEEFERFKTKHNKEYKTKDEHFKRLDIFKNNLRFIQYKNRMQKSYKLAANRFADMTEEEMQVLLGTELSEEAIDSMSEFHDNSEGKDDISEQFDWRLYSAITPAKDQTEFCGSCYAFATAAALESSAYIAKGCRNLEEVSEQAIMDCSWGAFGSKGCEGGRLDYAMVWVKKHGIPFTKEYGPYLSLPGYCHINQSRLLMISDFQQLPRNVTAIKNFIRTHGPLAISINFPKTAFFYSSGIYDDKECTSIPEMRSHSATIVGYGKEMGKRFWIVKNSYGAQWGENGYIKLSMDSNLCGAANYATGVIFSRSHSDQCFHGDL